MKNKVVLIGLNAVPVRLAHVLIRNCIQPRKLLFAIFRTNAFLHVGESDYLSVAGIRNDRHAVRAGPVTRQKARQDIHGDIRAGAADELAIALDWIP